MEEVVGEPICPVSSNSNSTLKTLNFYLKDRVVMMSLSIGFAKAL